ncbi:hypothetical protein [Aliikangiella coralliicola]|uniref:Uncharacterized protein n=1 Tax=Aliikangiella coralliicola TaxID=2592383 RepID=A0A545UJX8_9GAMM|nr:hypothetical protein [Aliikangiella coralliicola]TQV89759.1 hypothetical protein FLL46_02440 [Aliikangiella coralliicola]
MDKNSSSDVNFTVIDGERIYVGPERRAERRRRKQNERIETLLRNFGLDRRLRVDRRRKDTSWLLTSKRVVNQ